MRIAVVSPLKIAVAMMMSSAAFAWEAPTHAGLTERAALAAALHQELIGELGRPLGLYENLKLLPGDNELERRLVKLDPEGGYSPDGGRQTALGWIVAGAVLEGVPAARTRNHFFDPAQRSGLDQDGRAARTRAAAAVSGIGSLRGIFTGANFDGSGRPSLEWMLAPRAENDWGLARFLDERERAASAPTVGEREDAMARALLSAGAIAHLIEDAGDPAMVHNDWREALAQGGAPFERYVASRYGRLAIPAPTTTALSRPHLAELVHDAAGQGLADRTARRFFSAGSLPPIGATPPPALQPPHGQSGYISSSDVGHLAAFRKERAGVVYWLDDRCHRDYAEALLPEIGRSVITAFDLLFRGKLEIAASDGKIEVRAPSSEGSITLGKGRVTLFADDDKGNRKVIASADVPGGEVLLSTGAPSSKRLAALFRGVDSNGEPIVVAREATLP